MSKKMKWVLVGALGLVLAVGTAWSYKQAEDQGDPGPGPMRAQGPEAMPMLDDPSLREQLGLTEEQVSKLRGLGFEAAKAGLRARSEMMLKRLELEELLQGDEPDRAALDKKIRELADTQYALLKNQTDHRLAFRQVLTPEQRTKARTLLRQHMRQRMMERGGMMRGPQGRGFRPGRGAGPGGGIGPGPDSDLNLEPEEPALD